MSESQDGLLATNRSMRAQSTLNRAPSSDNQEIFMIPRQKSHSKDRRGSRMFLVDGQLCWAADQPAGFKPGRRNSSVGMFGSSMDLSGIGQSIDSSGGAGSGSEEAISYRIKWCRENIVQLKRQTWPMEKKLQVLKASKMFIKQHQGELKQSKQAKDVIASTSAFFERYWRHFKREFANFLVIITPWEMRIKKIESHFGSVVASYFTFLRWIFWLNLANSLVMVSFVMVPELIENVPDLTGMRKGELGIQRPTTTDGSLAPAPEFNPTLGEMWEFEGFLKFSPIFYGYYSNVEISKSGFWRNPLAFLMSAMLTYLFCFFCISRKLSQNTKLSRIGSKDDEYTFCWTVFVGWDFMIGNSETAYNKTSSLVMNLKEGILEEKEQTKDRDWRLIIRRVFANVLTLMLIVASAYVVTLAVQRSENLPEDASLLQKNELQLVMSGIQFMFPPLFDVIGIIEKYHPRKALSWQLGRILFLDFLNFYTLMFSLFGTVDQMGMQLNEVSGNITLLRKNLTYYNNLFAIITTTTTTTTTTTLTTTQLPETTTLNDTMFNSSTLSYELLNSTTNTTLMPNSSSFENNSVNATTILTTILLATTAIPQNSTNTSTELSTGTTTLEPPLMSTVAILSTTTTTTTTTVTSTLSELTTEPYKDQQMFSITSSTKILSSTKAPDDEDYPDLGELLKVDSKSPTGRRKRETRFESDEKRKRRKKRRERKTALPATFPDEGFKDEVIRIDGAEREESGVSDDLTRRNYPSTAGGLPQSTRPNQVSQSPRVYRPYIPPLQDPYRKAAQPHWLPGASSRGSDDDEDEPLEGRMEPSKVTTSSTTVTTTRRIGLARPIGGQSQGVQRGSRVKMTQAPPLNDDAMDDMMEGSTESGSTLGYPINPTQPGSNSEIFFEPTTPKLTQAGSSGPDYSILDSTDSTTFSINDASATSNSITSQQASDATKPQEPLQGKSSLSSGRVPDGSLSSIPMNSEGTTTELPSSCSPRSNQEDSNISPFTGLNRTSLSKTSNLKSSGFNASEVNYSDCIVIPEFKPQEILGLNETFKDKLKSLCWETMFGQEMVKIVVMDLVMTVISAVSIEFMRACFVRYCNRFFFWDLERGFPGYQDFKLAENVLHLVNNQSTVWMGMFFAPGLPAINTVKLAVLMYVRSWAVLTCNIPHETVFKVSKSNNFYYWILLINLLICILPVAYAVTWIRPSWHCGPFGGECRMYIVVTKLVKSMLPPEANNVFKYLTSPGAVIPILIALILIIYYLASTVSSSKEANKELKAQLKKDKEQEVAVPEITNTTVVDPAPVTPVSTAPISGPLAATRPEPTLEPVGLTGPSIGQNVAANVSTANSNTLAPQASLARADSRPKSLLVPPTA